MRKIIVKMGSVVAVYNAWLRELKVFIYVRLYLMMESFKNMKWALDHWLLCGCLFLLTSYYFQAFVHIQRDKNKYFTEKNKCEPYTYHVFVMRH